MKKKEFKDILAIVEEKIASFDWKIEPVGLYKPIEYSLSLGGKRIRPVLTLVGCSLFSEDLTKALSPAVALEVFHNFTLLHDDIMDRADMRRGKPTVHAKWNDNVAILSGDAMLIKSYELLMECDEKVLKSVLDVFNKTSVGVCEGQQYDMEFESRNNVTIDEYLEMIRLKTAVLLAGSLKIGAICGGASAKDADLLYDFGINIGLAFQLQDDILDVYGDPSKFGKAIGGDICCNKKTYLLITALKKADAITKANMISWISRKTFDKETKIKEFTAIYDALEVRKDTEDAIQRYYEKAVSLLKQVSSKEDDKEILYKISEQLINRQV